MAWRDVGGGVVDCACARGRDACRYDLSKELKLVISPAMRGLVSPPYTVVKNGIGEMRKWWDTAPAEVKATVEASADSTDTGVDVRGGHSEATGTANLPGRVTKRRPMRNRGESSRHVWAENETEPVLIINFFNGEIGEVYGDLQVATPPRERPWVPSRRHSSHRPHTDTSAPPARWWSHTGA